MYGSTSIVIAAAALAPRAITYGPEAKSLFSKLRRRNGGCASLLSGPTLTLGLLSIGVGIASLGLSSEVQAADTVDVDCDNTGFNSLGVISCTNAPAIDIVTDGNLYISVVGSVSTGGINVTDDGTTGVDISVVGLPAAAGAITSTSDSGIFVNTDGGDIVITTRSGNAFTASNDAGGNDFGVYARTYDSGTIDINLYDTVSVTHKSGDDGVSAISDDGDINIYSNSLIKSAGARGVEAYAWGSGDVIIGFSSVDTLNCSLSSPMAQI